MHRTPPPWFEDIRQEVLEGWERREKNPEDLGVWKNLFSQIQYPHHVVSELVQNAEDAGATMVEVLLEGQTFVFRHDGHDFSEEEFRSLCRFGYSNKRNLWTIGFRGMGFKSLFSLGPTVEVLTPTLSVRYHKDRFTLPEWTGSEPSTGGLTEIRVPVEGEEVFRKIEQQIEGWAKNPLPLLFLENIRELRIGDTAYSANKLGKGPVPGTLYHELAGTRLNRILRIPLALGVLPEDCLQEIREERGTVKGLENRPIHAVALLGRGVDRRLFVMLPTPVEHGIPVALHAPFLLSPSRTELRDLSISPTNRWLLRRAGEELGAALLKWLDNHDLSLAERARAYDLLPTQKAMEDAEEGEDDVTALLLDGLRGALTDEAIVLTSNGTLEHGEEVAALPGELLHAWGPDRARVLFAHEKSHVIAIEAARSIGKLRIWSELEPEDEHELLQYFLDEGHPLPEPESFEGLMKVWMWVKSATEKVWSGYYYRHERKNWWHEYHLMPVLGSTLLAPHGDVVRLPKEQPEGIDEEHWAELKSLVKVLDPEWIGFVERRVEQNPELAEVWSDLDLQRGSPLSELWVRAARFHEKEGYTEEDLARLLAIAAVADIELSEEAKKYLHFPCSDGTWRSVVNGLFLDLYGTLESLLPPEWIAQRVVDTRFLDHLDSRERNGVLGYLHRKVLSNFPLPEKSQESIWGRESFEDHLARRGCDPPKNYPYNYRNPERFECDAIDWPKELLDYWRVQKPWQDIGLGMLENWSSLSGMTHETAFMYSSTNRRRELEIEIPATWLVRIRRFPILKDDSGKPAVPTDLVWPSSENKLLPGVRLLHPNLATPDNHDALKMLGIRDHATDIRPVLDNILTLSKAGIMPVDELERLFKALERILDHTRETEEFEENTQHLRSRLLIPTPTGWYRPEEVFQANPSEIPGVSTILPELADLHLWPWLGLRATPGEHDALEWFEGLLGKDLDPDTLEIARAVVRKYPHAVAGRGIWLNLAGDVRPIPELKWTSVTPPKGLVSWLREETADLSIPENLTGVPKAFRDTSSLDNALSLKLAEEPGNSRPLPDDEVSWLETLGEILTHVRSAKNDTHEVEGLRRVGKLLANTTVLRADDLLVELTLDGRSVSDTLKKKALWDGSVFYLTEPMGPTMEDPVVEEVLRSKPELPEKLLHHAYRRNEQWIRAAVEEYFELSGTPYPVPPEKPVGPEPPPTAGPAIGKPEKPPRPVITKPQDPRSVLLNALKRCGFRLHQKKRTWHRDGGMELWETKEKTFPWAFRRGNEAKPQRAIVRVGSLLAGDALNLDGAVWKEGPALRAVLIELDSKKFAIHTFAELHEKKNKGELLVTPVRVKVFPVQ